METFIRHDQFNFICEQTKTLIRSHSSVKDEGVIQAVQSLAFEKVLTIFLNLTSEQKALLALIERIENEEDGTLFLASLKTYIIPFPELSEARLRKLFPKIKVNKAPLDTTDRKEISFFSWDDTGTQRRYIVAYPDNKHVGIEGMFSPKIVHGVCSICNHHGPQGLFTAKKKDRGTEGTYTKRGNYICMDTKECNQKITSLEKLNQFVQHLKP